MTKLIKSTAFKRTVGLVLAFLLVIGLYPYVQPNPEAFGNASGDAASPVAAEVQEVAGTATQEESLTDLEVPEDVLVETANAQYPEDDGLVAVPLDDENADEEGAKEEVPEEDLTTITGDGDRLNAYGEIPVNETVVGDLTYKLDGVLRINGILQGDIYIEDAACSNIVIEGQLKGSIYVQDIALPNIAITKDGCMDGSLVLRKGGTNGSARTARASVNLDVDGALNGNITVSDGTTLVIDGASTGVITGAKAGGSVINVEGSNLTLKGNVKLTGGNGSALNNVSGNWGDMNPTYGGAILVQRDKDQMPSHVKVFGGVLTGNEAAYGGGIYVDEACSIVMEGGSVIDNNASQDKAVSGIYFAKVAEDTSVTIASGKRVNGGIRIDACAAMKLTINGSVDGQIQVWDSSPTIAVGTGGTLNGSVSIQGSEATKLTVDGQMIGNVEAYEAGGNLTMVVNGKLAGDISLDPGTGDIAINGTMQGNLLINASTAKLTVDGYLNGQIKETNSANLTLFGEGVIGSNGNDAKIAGSVINVIASSLTIEGNVKIQGGTGSKFEYDVKDEKTNDGYGKAKYQGSGWYFHLANDKIDTSMTFGGGILVQRDGTDGTKGSSLYMKNGTVCSNTASAGGGIMIDQFCDFVMDNGAIDGNIASNGEGGGLYLLKEGVATINAGSITNNRTETTRDWGGGGIFIQSQRTLTFGNAATITNNEARGLGGGLSGCPHAAMGIGEITNGFAVYSNKAKGENPNFENTNSFLWNNNGVGDQLFFKYNSSTKTYGLNAGGYSAFKDQNSTRTDRLDLKYRTDNSQDYYCVKNSYVFGQQLSEVGGNTAWKGVAFTSAGSVYKLADKDDKNGSLVLGSNPTKGAVTFTVNNGEWVKSTNASIGLTALEQPNTTVDRPILISGNYSNTHGGGIGCNGGVVMGSLPDLVSDSRAWSIEFDKKLLDLNGQELDMANEAGKFSFELYDANRGDKVIASAVNNADGKVCFEVDDPDYAGSAEGTIYKLGIREVSIDGYMPQDDCPVEVKVERKVTKYGSSDNNTIFQGRTVVESVVSQGWPKFGVDGQPTLTFVNTLAPLPTTWSLSATKHYAGNAATDAFTFSLYDLGSNPGTSSIKNLIAGKAAVATASVPAQSGVTANIALVAADGAEPFAVKGIGTKYFALVEDSGQDPTVYIYKVDGSAQVGAAQIDSAVTMTKAASMEATISDAVASESPTAAFNNYDAVWTPAGAVNKVYYTEGAVNTEPFRFDLRKADGADAVAKSLEASVVATGETAFTASGVKQAVDFGDYKDVYTKPGTYYYTIVEQSGQDPTVYVYKVTTSFVDNALQVTTALATASADQEDALNSLIYSDDQAMVPQITFYNFDVAWLPTATKYYMGGTTNETFSFNLFELKGVADDATLADLLDGKEPLITGSAAMNGAYEAAIDFGEPFHYNAKGTHYYALTEAGENPGDSKVFIYAVEVVSSDDATTYAVNAQLSFVASKDAKFAERVDLGATGTEDGISAEFVNYGDRMLSLAGYAVNFYTGAPVGKQCLVDPKIYKELTGRALREGEFEFELIGVNNFVDKTPTGFSVIAKNDSYGMVDFDKAGVIGYDDDGNPCCLSFTSPGTYTYIVQETNKTQDVGIKFDDTTITFTAVIDNDMKCTQMYYGHWDGEKNIRYTDDNGSDISSLENPNFHPTLTNEARPMDLRVRKTSALGRDENGLGESTGIGLNGAIYGLYMVNASSTNDIFLGQAESKDLDGEAGWMTFENVNLTEGSLYYVKEIKAPSEHTVDPFRSLYFEVVTTTDQSGTVTGYALRYKDSWNTDFNTQAEGDEAGTNEYKPTPAKYEGDRIIFTYDNGSGLGNGGVFDQTTSVSFSKRDTHTQEWVEGAKLQLIDAENGAVISQWVTGNSVHQIALDLNDENSFGLDVDHKYILREVEAPEGYDKAEDVVFSMNAYGALIIDEGSMKDGYRNCEVVDSQLTLYDVMFDTEVVVQEERVHERTTKAEETSSDKLPKTGDSIPVGLIIGVCGACILVIAFAALRMRRRTDEE